ncbi:hypothetical protein ACHAWF_002650, partial [Thalassiosira exigua]
MISSRATQRGGSADVSAHPAFATCIAIATQPRFASRRVEAIGLSRLRAFGLRPISVAVNGDIFQAQEKCLRPGVPRPLVQYRWVNMAPKVRLDGCSSLGDLIQKAHEHLEALSIRDIAAFWTEVSKFLRGRNQTSTQNNSGAQLKEILLRTLQWIGEFPFRDLTQTTLALAKIISQVENSGGRIHKDSAHGLLHDRLIGNRAQHKQLIFEELVAASMPILHEFDERHLSNLIYAFGLAKYVRVFEDESTNFDEFAIEIIPRLKVFEPRHLSNILWAYANAGAINHELFANAADIVIGTNQIRGFNSQDMSNMIWAYASAKEQHKELFEAVADRIFYLDSLRAFKPQSLSNIVWAYATASESHPKLFKKVAHHIVQLDSLRPFKPQDLSNIVWAYATARKSNKKMFKKVANHIVQLDDLRAFSPQSLANTVWAYATA